MTLGDAKNLTLNSVKMLSYLTQLFPLVFKEKLCEQLLEILKQLLENLVNTQKGKYTVQLMFPFFFCAIVASMNRFFKKNHFILSNTNNFFYATVVAITKRLLSNMKTSNTFIF